MFGVVVSHFRSHKNDWDSSVCEWTVIPMCVQRLLMGLVRTWTGMSHNTVMHSGMSLRVQNLRRSAVRRANTHS